MGNQELLRGADFASRDALMPSDFRFRPASTLAPPITHVFPVLAILMVTILPLVTVLVLGAPFW